MISPTVGATILFLAILTAGVVLGLAVAAMAFTARLPIIEGRAHARGVERGVLIGRRDAFLRMAGVTPPDAKRSA